MSLDLIGNHFLCSEQHELLGRPITLLCRGMDNGARDRVLHYAFASTRGSKLGPTFDLPLLWAAKKRHTKMLARSRFFFNDAVRVRATSFVCVCVCVCVARRSG